jgi:RNA polymerase sigma factor (sigma-70 family)
LESLSHIPESLIVKAGAGDIHACATIYNQLKAKMFGICLRMIGNRSDAQDILQDSFLIIFQNLSKLRNKSSIAGWMRIIVVRECIRFSKQKFRWQDVDRYEVADEDPSSWLFDIPPSAINEEIINLADGYRQIFTLFVFEEYSHKQIAKSLGISESTSRTQYHRAKQILKQRLEKMYRDG